MQCQRCGATLAAGAERCERCGAAAKAAMSPSAIKRLVCGLLTLLMALGIEACLFLPWLTIDGTAIVPLRLSQAEGLGDVLKSGFSGLAIALQICLVPVMVFAVLSLFVRHPRLALLSRLPGVALISLCAGVTLFSLVVGLLGNTTVLSFFELQTGIVTHSAAYVSLLLSIAVQVTTTLWRDGAEE